MACTSGSKTTISPETRVSLKVVIPVCVFLVCSVAGGVGAWNNIGNTLEANKVEIKHEIEGIKREMGDLSEAIQVGMADRWTRTDMYYFARENDLDMPDKAPVVKKGR